MKTMIVSLLFCMTCLSVLLANDESPFNPTEKQTRIDALTTQLNFLDVAERATVATQLVNEIAADVGLAPFSPDRRQKLDKVIKGELGAHWASAQDMRTYKTWLKKWDDAVRKAITKRLWAEKERLKMEAARRGDTDALKSKGGGYNQQVEDAKQQAQRAEDAAKQANYQAIEAREKAEKTERQLQDTKRKLQELKDETPLP